MSIFLGAVDKSKLSAKQIKAMYRVQKLMRQAQTIFEDENLNVMNENGNYIFLFTENAINKAVRVFDQEIVNYHSNKVRQ